MEIETMWKGELYIQDEESMEEFFNNMTLITEEEKDKAREVVEDADTVNWPIEIVFEIQDDSWSEFASKRPDEAKVIEQFLENDEAEQAEAWLPGNSFMKEYEIKYEGPSGKLRVATIDAEEFDAKADSLKMWENKGDDKPVFALAGFPYALMVNE